MDPRPTPPAAASRIDTRPAIVVTLLAALLVLVSVVLAPFASPLAWAVILGHATWPLFERLRLRLGGRAGPSALLMCAAVALSLVLPLLWMLVLLRADLLRLVQLGAGVLDRSTGDLLDLLARLPWWGPALHDWLGAHLPPETQLRDWIGTWLRQGSGQVLALIGGAGRNALKFAFAILFLFFVYRDGEAFLRSLRRVLADALDARLERYLQAAGDMSRAITQSLVLVALVQGVLAGLGYLAVGVAAPVLLGFVTALASLLPVFGTFLVWGTVSAWLLATGHWGPGLALLLWGTLLIHPVDNVLRPWLVSSATRTPFLVALIGVLGGLSSFGFVGLFVGPVILAVALVLWNTGERPSSMS